MPIYLLQRNGMTHYDEYDRFVIKAKDSKQARKLASIRDDYDKKVWLNPKKSSIEKVKDTGKSEIILDSFNAA